MWGPISDLGIRISDYLSPVSHILSTARQRKGRGSWLFFQLGVGSVPGMKAGSEKEGSRERKFGLSKGQFEIGEDFEFTEKEIEELFDLGPEKE